MNIEFGSEKGINDIRKTSQTGRIDTKFPFARTTELEPSTLNWIEECFWFEIPGKLPTKIDRKTEVI